MACINNPIRMTPASISFQLAFSSLVRIRHRLSDLLAELAHFRIHRIQTAVYAADLSSINDHVRSHWTVQSSHCLKAVARVTSSAGN